MVAIYTYTRDTVKSLDRLQQLQDRWARAFFSVCPIPPRDINCGCNFLSSDNRDNLELSITGRLTNGLWACTYTVALICGDFFDYIVLTEPPHREYPTHLTPLTPSINQTEALENR